MTRLIAAFLLFLGLSVCHAGDADKIFNATLTAEKLLENDELIKAFNGFEAKKSRSQNETDTSDDGKSWLTNTGYSQPRKATLIKTAKDKKGCVPDQILELSDGGDLARAPSQLQCAMKVNKSKFFNAYKEYKERAMSIGNDVEIMVAISITPEGQVAAAEVTDSSIADENFIKKLNAIVKETQFPEQQVETWEGSYLIRFLD